MKYLKLYEDVNIDFDDWDIEEEDNSSIIDITELKRGGYFFKVYADQPKEYYLKILELHPRTTHYLPPGVNMNFDKCFYICFSVSKKGYLENYGWMPDNRKNNSNYGYQYFIRDEYEYLGEYSPSIVENMNIDFNDWDDEEVDPNIEIDTKHISKSEWNDLFNINDRVVIDVTVNDRRYKGISATVIDKIYDFLGHGYCLYTFQFNKDVGGNQGYRDQGNLGHCWNVSWGDKYELIIHSVNPSRV